jgi:DNA polymerase III alpha subunit
MTQIVRLARRLIGMPHNFSVHPGGVVMGAMDIDHYAPVQPSPKGVRITQYDKDGVEAMGLVKLDILGNRNLSTVSEACELIARRTGRRVNIETVEPQDPATVRLLREADTVGCNQLESPAMRHLLRMMQPGGAADVMQALALIRPGAAGIGMKETFVRRRRGLEKTPAAPPLLEGLLDETHGVMMYEDDVMMVAAALAGLSLGEADRFRKAVQKCTTDQRRLELSQDFLSRCRGRGVDMDSAKDLWVQMAKFNAYSFCRAHAASYAAIAYAGAWLKTHYPLEFWTAALNNNQGMYHPRVYVELAKRDGIAFLLPDVNRSEAEFRCSMGILPMCTTGVPPVRGEGVSPLRPEGILPSVAVSSVASSSSSSSVSSSPPAIRIGLGLVEGLGPTGVEQILRHRESGPFEGLSDFLMRTGIGYTETRNLILCGAFDWTGRNRPALMMELNLFVRLGPHPTSYHPTQPFQNALVVSSQKPTHSNGWALTTEKIGPNGGSSRPARSSPLLLPRVPVIPNVPGDYDYERKYRDEMTILGVCAREHFLAFCRQRSPRLSELAGTDSRRLKLKTLVGRRVRLAGVIEARRYTATRSGQTMLFLTMADEQGTFEVSLFPDALARAGGGLERYGPYVVAGTVEDQYGAITVSAEEIGE